MLMHQPSAAALITSTITTPVVTAASTRLGPNCGFFLMPEREVPIPG
jgi:hypothetical protein